MEIKYPYGISGNLSCLTVAEFTAAMEEDVNQMLMGDESVVEGFSIKIRAYVVNENGQDLINAVIQRTNGEAENQDIHSTARLAVDQLHASALSDLHDFLANTYEMAGVSFVDTTEITHLLGEWSNVASAPMSLDDIQKRMSEGRGPEKVIVAQVIEVNYTLDPSKLQVSIASGFEYTINDAQHRRREAAMLGLKVEIPDSIRHQTYFAQEVTFETIPVFN